LARKKSEEDKLRKDVAGNPKLKDSASAWDQIAAAMQWQRENFKRLMWESDSALPGSLAGYARTLVRLSSELPQPNAKRLPEYQDQNIPSIEHRLTSTAPISRPLEIRQLTLALANLQENLTVHGDSSGDNGHDFEFVKQVLAGKTPADRAA
jgi:hypothetical protein